MIQSSMMLFDMYSGNSFGEAFSGRDWASLQYTTADFAAALGQKHMQGLIDKYNERENMPKSSDPWADPLANGLAMLGGVFYSLRKTEEDLRSFFTDIDEKVFNWFGDEGFNSDLDLLDMEQERQDNIEKAKYDKIRQKFKEILQEVVKKGTKNQGDINWTLGATFKISPKKAAELLKLITGLSSAEIAKKMKSGGLVDILVAAGVTHNEELMGRFIENYETVTRARFQKKIKEAMKYLRAMYYPRFAERQVQRAGFLSGAISFFKNGYTLAHDFIFGEDIKAKQLALQSLKKVGKNEYIFTIEDVEFHVSASSWSIARGGGYTFNQVMEKMNNEVFEVLRDMATDSSLNVKSVEISSLFRHNRKKSPHYTGIAVDITRITDKDGNTVSYRYEDYNNTDIEYRNKVYKWMKDNPRVSQAWDPYDRFSRGVYDRKNRWNQYGKKYGEKIYNFKKYKNFKNYMKSIDPQLKPKEMIQMFYDIIHRHHLHMTMYGGN